MGTHDRVTAPLERMTAPPERVTTDRLELVLLTAPWLAAVGEGAAPPDLGFSDPHDAFDDAAYVVALRLEQVRLEPTALPWLLRAVVLRETGQAIGHVGFHGPPDEHGAVEIGYRVLPAFRRRGYAREAVEGMWAAAKAAGARVLRASVSPDNDASLALVRGAGFVQVGDQLDEIDGLELVFERPA